MTGRSVAVGVFVSLALAAGARAAEPDVRTQVRAYRTAHEKEIVRELSDLVALPNVANKVADIDRNTERLTEMLRRRGFEVQRLSAGDGKPPSLSGELRVPNARRAVVVYAHLHRQAGDQKGWPPDPW